MANNCQNDLELEDTPENCKLLKSLINEGKLDFDLIIPTPKSLLDFHLDNNHDLALYVYMTERGTRALDINAYESMCQWKNSITHVKKGFEIIANAAEMLELFSIGMGLVNNFKKHGSTNWYYWRKLHWGVNFNSHDIQYEEDSQNIIRFNTPWSYPLPIIKELVTKHKLTGSFKACEPNNLIACRMDFEDGEIILLNEPSEDSKEFRDIHDDVLGYAYEPDEC